MEALEDRQLLSASPMPAGYEKTLATPTGWGWYYNETGPQLRQIVNGGGYRIIDLKVQSGGAHPLFCAALVHNSGAYHDANPGFISGRSAADLNAIADSRHQRITAVEQYENAEGKQRFAAVLVDNSGPHARNWGWYYNVSPQFVNHVVRSGNYRLVDLDRHADGRLDVVMVKNRGVDVKAWWWYTNVTGDFLAQAYHNNTNAEVTSIQYQPENGRFTVLMERNDGGAWRSCWWGFNQDQVEDRSFGGGHQRIVSIDPYWIDGQQCFATAMIQNV